MQLQEPQVNKALLPVLLLVTIGELLNKLIASLHPELHMFEWSACALGAIGGQVLFRAEGVSKIIGGLFVGYVVALYWGVDLAHLLNLKEPNAGRVAAALLADVLGRSLAYIIQHPRECTDFVIEKGGKLTVFLANDIIMNNINNLLDRFGVGKKKT